VGDDEDTSLEGLESLDEGSERFTIEVVWGRGLAMNNGSDHRKLTSRLIQADDVGTTPCSSAEDDLDLLTTRETTHGVVGDELGVETEVGEVLLDLATNEGAQETEALGLTGINFKDFL
jgi:hypothetical protein